jgi:hypothetical protein
MKKGLKIAILSLPIALLLAPFRAFAQGGFGWFSEGIAWLIGAIGQLFSYIAGVFLTLAGSLVDLMLDLNISYITKDNDLVSTGWQISRDLANLGFVLAIIVIAFATIIQYKSYGAKKMLPKLIAAALLVNFSMAIAMPVIGFSNTITKFFLAGQINTGFGENVELSQAIAGAFGPQRFLMGQTEGGDPVAPSTGEDPGMFGGFGTAVIMATASVLFTIIFTTIATIVFFALAIMLMIRYVFLALLLILAPMAWLVWVIPGLENQFSKWWSNFFKWSFFAPAVSFFIYLTLVGAKELSTMSMSGIEGNFTGDLKNIMSQGAQMTILCGLMIGGLIAAQSLGIHGAKGAISVAKSAGNWGKRWAVRKGKQWGSTPFRAKYGKENKSLAERSQNWASQGGWKGMLGKTFSRPLSNISAVGEKAVGEYEKNAEKLTPLQIKSRLATTINLAQKIAYLKNLAKTGKLTGDEAAKYVNPKTKKQFANFGQNFNDIEKAAGMSAEMNEALKKNDMSALEQGSTKYIKPLKGKDVESMPWDSALRSSARGEGGLGFDNEKLNSLLDHQLRAVIKTNPTLTYKIIPTLGSEALGSFEEKYRKTIDSELAKATAGSDLHKKLQNTKKGFEKSIAKHTFNT